MELAVPGTVEADFVEKKTGLEWSEALSAVTPPPPILQLKMWLRLVKEMTDRRRSYRSRQRRPRCCSEIGG